MKTFFSFPKTKQNKTRNNKNETQNKQKSIIQKTTKNKQQPSQQNKIHTHTHQNKTNKQRIRNQFCVGQLLLCMGHTIGEDCFSFSQVLNVNSMLVRGMISPSQCQDFVSLNQCRSWALPGFPYCPPPLLPSSRITEK